MRSLKCDKESGVVITTKGSYMTKMDQIWVKKGGFEFSDKLDNNQPMESCDSVTSSRTNTNKAIGSETP